MRPSISGLAVVLFLSFWGSTFSQKIYAQAAGEGSVAGRVTDATTGDPVSGASVRWRGDGGPPRVANTDADGRYRLDGVAAGSQQISAAALSPVPDQWNYQTSGATVVIVANDTVTANIQLVRGPVTKIVGEEEEPEGSTDELLNQLRGLDIIGDALGREEVEQAPGGTRELVQKAPGVTVQEDFIFVRGLGDRYSAIQFDLRTIPSPEPERKAVPISLFPKGLIDRLVILKTYQANLPGEFAGGLVQIATRDIPRESFFSLSVSAEGFDGTTFTRFNSSKNGKYDRFTIADDTHALPSEVPQQRVFSTLLDPENRQILGRSFRNTWEVNETVAPLNLGVGMSFGGKWDTGPLSSLGIVGSISWDNEYRNVNNEERRFLQVIQGDLAIEEEDELNTSVFEADLNGVLNLVYQLNPGNKFGVRNLVVRNIEDRVRLTATRDFRNERDERQIDIQFIDRRLYNSQVFGEHLLLGDTFFEWRAGYSRVERDEPDHRNVRYIQEFGDPTFRLTSGIEGNSRQWLFLEEDSYEGAFDFTIPFAPFYGDPFGMRDDPETPDPSIVKANQGITVGAFWLNRERDFESRLFTYDPGPVDVDGDPIDFTLSPEELFSDDNINPDGFVIRESTENTDSYLAEETNTAVYAMANFRLSKSFRMNGGVRLERSEQEVVTTQRLVANPQEIRADLDDTDLLPSLTLTYEFTKKQLFRLAASQTVNRPTIRELSPVRFQNTDGFRAQGNAELERALLRSLDFRYEYFPARGELFSLSFFYKQIEDPIERVTFAVSEISVDSFENADEAELYGVEFELRKKLGFVSDSLKDFELKANFARIISEVEIPLDPIDQQTNNNRALQGQPLFTANLGLTYNNFDRGLAVTLAANTFGKRISRVGISGVPDEKEQPRIDLSLSVSKNIGDGRLRVTLENILDEDFEFQTGGVTTRKFKTGLGLGVSYSVDF